jgi:D-alanine transaminase/branched-chain amino acid aminotransferase
LNNPFVVINDEFIPADQARIAINDLAIQRGYGIFDFFKTVNGIPVFLDQHLERFYRSAERMRLSFDRSPATLKEILFELIKRNGFSDSGVRITLTGGYSVDGYSTSTPNLLITQQPLVLTPGIQTPLRLVSYGHQRQMPEVKTIDYLMAIWLKPFVTDNNADEVLYHQQGIVSECPRANFFIVTNANIIVTPARNILKGVIRSNILSLSTEGFNIEERDLHLEEIYDAREAFITSTTKNILPIITVDGKKIGDGTVGETTQLLSDALSVVVNREVENLLNREDRKAESFAKSS